MSEGDIFKEAAMMRDELDESERKLDEVEAEAILLAHAVLRFTETGPDADRARRVLSWLWRDA